MRLIMNLKVALALGTLLLGAECAPAATPAEASSVSKDTTTTTTDKVFKIHTNEFVKYFPPGSEIPSSLSTAPAAAGKLKLKLRHPSSSSEPESSKNEANVLQKRGDYCGHSSFHSVWSYDSPSTGDCWQIYHNIAGGGQWQVWTSAHRTLVSYGGCAFGVEIDQDFISFQYVGAWDIRDLIRDSINNYASGGKVGTGGKMTCGVKHTEWGLF
ncbi:putative necrosis-inducing factor-domain-containing protein [Triangularia setosa]|uniref:Necrosis-inducing factor-domain-containing protein n=1 Tax=Triangularia setosa TaxID=2587417 RepID=A0AAN7A5G1_9PEZI|nr:putative necrosis-inducing factor-domain-containing protein [Podospora setosa]